MIRIIKDGKVIYETDDIYKAGDEMLFHDYDVKEIVVYRNPEYSEEYE